MAKPFIPKFFILFALFCFSVLAQALSEPFPAAPAGSLFASSQPLKVKLTAPLNKLLAARVANPDLDEKIFEQMKKASVDGTLSYVEEKNGVVQTIQVPVEVHMKGYTTLLNCPFPKFELKVLSAQGTLFADLKSVDLNSHCGELSEINSDNEPVIQSGINNHREAFIHGVLEVFEMPSLKARPIWIEYVDTSTPRLATPVPGKEYPAILVEDFGDLRRRLEAKEVKAFNPKKISDKKTIYEFKGYKVNPEIDQEDIVRISLFQALIQNIDWGVYLGYPDPSQESDGDISGDVLEPWNLKIVALPNGKWVMFPQDFSFSLWLEEHEPLFVNFELKRGYTTANPALQQKIKSIFLEKRERLYELLSILDKDPKGQQKIRRIMDEFYKALPDF